MLCGADFESYLLYSFQLRSLSSPSEIVHNDDILRIFLMACEVRTVKLSVIGLSCLQKLITHDAVAPSALKEILSTLKNVSNYEYFTLKMVISALRKTGSSIFFAILSFEMAYTIACFYPKISLFYYRSKPENLPETWHLYNKMMLYNLSNENNLLLFAILINVK